MTFTKYQGAGNDFIMILRSEWEDFNESLTPHLCDRRMGIGADGVIVIEPSEDFDFDVNYLNADGSKSFCGNGARCSVAFAKEKNVFTGSSTCFSAIDGTHTGEILDNNRVKVSMKEVDTIHQIDKNAFTCDTGSPHYVIFTENIQSVNVDEGGKKIRYSEPYREDGINVNWIEQIRENEYKILTYERGVEGETFACGTGATAAALIASYVEFLDSPVSMHAKGGALKVHFEKKENRFTNIFLEGPAQKVYEGKWDLK